MSDSTLLYLGVCCFALMLLGLVLTILEFRRMSALGVNRMSASGVKPVKNGPVALPPRVVATDSKSRVR